MTFTRDEKPGRETDLAMMVRIGRDAVHDAEAAPEDLPAYQEAREAGGYPSASIA